MDVSRRMAMLAALALPVPNIARILSCPEPTLLMSDKAIFRIKADTFELNKAFEEAACNLDRMDMGDPFYAATGR